MLLRGGFSGGFVALGGRGTGFGSPVFFKGWKEVAGCGDSGDFLLRL